MTTARNPVQPAPQYTRREALELLGAVAGAGVVAASSTVQAQQTFVSAEPPSFPAGAIIRTLQGDLDPRDLANGATLFHEHVGRADKVRMVQDLLDAGLEDHILLSSDHGNERQFKRYYGHGWSSVLMQFVPKLRYAGVPEEAIRKILVDNPRRFLAFVPKP